MVTVVTRRPLGDVFGHWPALIAVARSGEIVLGGKEEYKLASASQREG